MTSQGQRERTLDNKHLVAESDLPWQLQMSSQGLMEITIDNTNLVAKSDPPNFENGVTRKRQVGILKVTKYITTFITIKFYHFKVIGLQTLRDMIV